MGFWCYWGIATDSLKLPAQGHTDLILYISGSCDERFIDKILVEVIIIRGFIQFHLEVFIVRALFLSFNAATIREILLFDVTSND